MLNISVTCDWCGITADMVMFSAEEPAGWTIPGENADAATSIFETAENYYIGDIESALTLCPDCSGHVVLDASGFELTALDAVGEQRENLFNED